jgi:hypothetical protein
LEGRRKGKGKDKEGKWVKKQKKRRARGKEGSRYRNNKLSTFAEKTR